MKQQQLKTIEIGGHDAAVIRHALVKQWKAIKIEVDTLKLAKERDLTCEERWMLPANLQWMTRDELLEQIDPWISLQSTIEFWINKFKIDQ